MADMTNKQVYKKIAVNVLKNVGDVASFLSSFHPFFEHLSTLAKGAQSCLDPEQSNALENDFMEINTNLQLISEKNQQIMKDIVLNEVIENYGSEAKIIKYQYKVFVEATEKAFKNPENAQRYMDEFKDVYVNQKQNKSLSTIYRGLVGQKGVFGRPLLEVFQESCNGDRDKMEHICAYLMYIIQIGVIAHMGYRAATLDDVATEEKTWSENIKEILLEMEKVLKE